MEDSRCSVLLSSCDKYEDAWRPFFFFFNREWRNCPYQIYLNTETKGFSIEGKQLYVLNSGECTLSWSLRLKKALQRIKTEYVLFLLEDFFMLDKVNQEEINRCLDIMDENHKISVIDFECAKSGEGEPCEYEGYCRRNLNSMYFLNCQASIWRRKDLIRFLSPYESPWQFEIYGSGRAKLYNRIFLLRSSQSPKVFNYNVNWDTGYGLHGGKWLKSNVSLFEQNGIEVDYSRMGFYEKKENEEVCPIPRVTLRERLRYLIFSGYDIRARMSIRDQIRLLIKKPREYWRMEVQKIKKCISREFY